MSLVYSTTWYHMCVCVILWMLLWSDMAYAILMYSHTSVNKSILLLCLYMSYAHTAVFTYWRIWVSFILLHGTTCVCASYYEYYCDQIWRIQFSCILTPVSQSPFYHSVCLCHLYIWHIRTFTWHIHTQTHTSCTCEYYCIHTWHIQVSRILLHGTTYVFTHDTYKFLTPYTPAGRIIQRGVTQDKRCVYSHMTNQKKTWHMTHQLFFFDVSCVGCEKHTSFVLNFSHPTHDTWKDFFDVSCVNIHIFCLVCVNFSHPTHTQGSPSVSNNAAQHKAKMCVHAWHVQISYNLTHPQEAPCISNNAAQHKTKMCVFTRDTYTFLTPYTPAGRTIHQQQRGTTQEEEWERKMEGGVCRVSENLTQSTAQYCTCMLVWGGFG